MASVTLEPPKKSSTRVLDEPQREPLVKPPSKAFLSAARNDRVGQRSIYGIGRNYNRELGVGAFRTGAAVRLNVPLERSVEIIKNNIRKMSVDPEACCRLMAQHDQFWFSDADAETLCEMLVSVGGTDPTARSERLRSDFNEVEPVGICVCEAVTGPNGEEEALATWLFRHDVIDGWRALRYLCRMVLETSDLTLDRLAARHESGKKKAGAATKCCMRIARSMAMLALTPPALGRLINIGTVKNDGEKRKFYAHVVCTLPRLKEVGQERRTGSLTTTLTACILEAYLAADPKAARCNIASNVLFNADSPHGNHMCIKICTVARKGSSLRKTAKTLNAASQKVCDSWVAGFSRLYALGKLPDRFSGFIDRQQKGLDFLVSSLPAFDACTPDVVDLTVSREFTAWQPSIVYALGIQENLYLDFYWEVRPSFSDEAFLSTFSDLVEAVSIRTEMPPAY